MKPGKELDAARAAQLAESKLSCYEELSSLAQTLFEIKVVEALGYGKKQIVSSGNPRQFHKFLS